jgi:hypothetical protein
MHLRGIYELRDSKQIGTRSASAKDFIEAMKELHNQLRNDCRVRTKNISEEKINTGDNFSSKLVI